MIALLTSRLAGGLYAAVAIIALLFGVAQCGARNGERDRAQLAEAATKAETVKLWACSGNLTAVRAGIDQKNADIEAQRKAFEAKLNASQMAGDAARKEMVTAQARAHRLLSTALPGADQCIRMLQADEAVVRELRQ